MRSREGSSFASPVQVFNVVVVILPEVGACATASCFLLWCAYTCWSFRLLHDGRKHRAAINHCISLNWVTLLRSGSPCFSRFFFSFCVILFCLSILCLHLQRSLFQSLESVLKAVDFWSLASITPFLDMLRATGRLYFTKNKLEHQTAEKTNLFN